MKRATALIDEIVDAALRIVALGAAFLFVIGIIAVGYLYVRAVAVVPR